MTTSMLALVRRFAAKVAGNPDAVEVRTQPEHHALCLAWKARTSSHLYEGVWSGPGVYGLSGYYGDRGASVATIRRVAPPRQLELGL